jgi:sterol desaturase/sphingolipid hydroxylase (fatty acid hydroxylase superfamily)
MLGVTLEHQLSSLMPYVYYGTWPLFLFWEVVFPARKMSLPLLARWGGNFGLFAINLLSSRLVLIMLGVGILTYADDHGLGMISRAELPRALVIAGGVLLIDLSTYAFHVLFHKFSWLWRLHRVHHTDPEMDFSTNFRHHPLELVASTSLSIALALVAGFPPEALIINQLLSQLIEPMSHSNIRLPLWLDNVLRLIFVTPAMHLVHHSADGHETDSNYGMNFSFWDRLFRTYIPAPALGEKNMLIGLETFRDMKSARLPGALAVPFLSP